MAEAAFAAARGSAWRASAQKGLESSPKKAADPERMPSRGWENWRQREWEGSLSPGKNPGGSREAKAESDEGSALAQEDSGIHSDPNRVGPERPEEANAHRNGGNASRIERKASPGSLRAKLEKGSEICREDPAEGRRERASSIQGDQPRAIRAGKSKGLRPERAFRASRIKARGFSAEGVMGRLCQKKEIDGRRDREAREK